MRGDTVVEGAPDVFELRLRTIQGAASHLEAAGRLLGVQTDDFWDDETHCFVSANDRRPFTPVVQETGSGIVLLVVRERI